MFTWVFRKSQLVIQDFLFGVWDINMRWNRGQILSRSSTWGRLENIPIRPEQKRTFQLFRWLMIKRIIPCVSSVDVMLSGGWMMSVLMVAPVLGSLVSVIFVFTWFMVIMGVTVGREVVDAPRENKSGNSSVLDMCDCSKQDDFRFQSIMCCKTRTSYITLTLNQEWDTFINAKYSPVSSLQHLQTWDVAELPAVM